MGEHERQRFRTAPFDMIEVDIEIIHAREELGIAIEVRFRFTPVECAGPVFGQRLHECPVGAVAPVGRVETVGQSRFLDTVENPVDRRLRDAGHERPGRRALLRQ